MTWTPTSSPPIKDLRVLVKKTDETKYIMQLKDPLDYYSPSDEWMLDDGTRFPFSSISYWQFLPSTPILPNLFSWFESLNRLYTNTRVLMSDQFNDINIVTIYTKIYTNDDGSQDSRYYYVDDFGFIYAPDEYFYWQPIPF